MTITMTNWMLTWTGPDGKRRLSAVSYDKPSAEHRRRRLEDEGCTDIDIIETKPGVLPDITP
ncbi:hypothetical protein [Streptomyces sp. Da 82-17]|uniref:hypothetical protein n=1 Tax=Streptomyces sp. Da 82-17 TaxID=3377116 RepID=UPI0038D4CC0A